MKIKPIAYREQKPMENKLILHYSKEDLEAVQKKGVLWIDTTYNPNEHVCQVATIIGANKQLNEEHLLFEGDYVLVQYLVGLDTFDPNGNTQRNMFFMEKLHDDSELRWCHISQVFGKKTKDGFEPLKGFVFCEKIKHIEEHYEGNIFVPEQKIDSDTKGYETTIKYIHPIDSEQLNLKAGDRIIADKQTDATKKVFGEELLRVPANSILGLVEV